MTAKVIADHTEVKTLLDLIRSAAKGVPTPIQEVCRIFKRRTQDGRKMEQYSNLLTAAIRSMIDVKDEKDLDSLFSGGRTTALVHTIAGLDDFELIAFLVVEEATAMTAFFDYPKAAAFGRVVPKNKIYEHAGRARR